MQKFCYSLFILSLIIFSPVTLSSAQTLAFGLAFGSNLQLEPELSLSDLDVGDSEVAIRLAGSLSGPLELSLEARETQSFGPLGNLTFYSEAAFRGAHFKTELGAEGVVAQIAGKAKLSLSTIQPGLLSAAEMYEAKPESFFADLFAGSTLKADLGLSASYRLNRTLILSAEPNVYYIDDAGAGASLKTNVRFVSLMDRDDGYVYLHGQTSALNNDYAALGVGYDLNRRGLPNLQGSLWLGVSADGVKPGAGLELSQSFRDLGARYSMNLNAEPFRADVLPYRAGLSYTQTVGQSDIQLEVYGTLKNTFGAAFFASKLSYLWRF